MYTYAFLKPPQTTITLPPGIQHPTQIIQGDHLCALVEPELSPGTLDDKSEDQLMQAVLNHDRVLCEVFRQTDLLPLRFGTCFISLTALLDHLKQHQESYGKKLEILASKAEFTLKCIPLEISSNPPPAVSETPLKGRDYFLAKKRLYEQQSQQQQGEESQWEELSQTLTELTSEIVWAEPQGNEKKVYLLIPRIQASELIEKCQTWQSQYSQWQLSLSEGLPPYHFV